MVGSTMTPEVAVRYGAAFGRHLQMTGVAADPGAYVIVGRDSRTSGDLLSPAAAAVLRAEVVAVRDAGIAPTQTIILAVRDEERALAGKVLTDSHNPI